MTVSWPPTSKAWGGRTANWVSRRSISALSARRSRPPGSGTRPEAWTDAAAAAWEDLFSWAAQLMISAAERDAKRAPPWWLAEIVAYEARSADLAVLTLQPCQPVPYLPGQHVPIQTPRWPRLWRHYSIANAPREDGTLTIHVRAVPGGLVSPLPVHHVAVGDTSAAGSGRPGR